MTLRLSWNHPAIIFGGTALWGAVLIGCVAVNRTMLVPPQVAGASFVGTKECTQCHEEHTEHFDGATHARLNLSDEKVGDTGCEACHGPGSLHAKAGGGKGNIVNPRQSPETCFQCHLDKRAQFSLANSHQVLNGKMGCGDCHEPHKGNVVVGTGVDIEGMNAVCTKCHTQQKGPFVYEHGAMREGCVACHNPHGSVNQKMLVARDANLCLRCHLEAADVGSSGQINANAIRRTVENHNSRLMQGTCWSASCHEQPHGSNASYHFRN